LAGCGGILVPPHYVDDRRGRIPVESLEFIHLGTTSREDVLLRLGEPDAVGRESMTFAYCSRWIIGYREEGWGFRSEVQEELLLIGFADNQTVARYEVRRPSIFGAQRFCGGGLIEYW
jgi:hypothetical protein